MLGDPRWPSHRGEGSILAMQAHGSSPDQTLGAGKALRAYGAHDVISKVSLGTHTHATTSYLGFGVKS